MNGTTSSSEYPRRDSRARTTDDAPDEAVLMAAVADRSVVAFESLYRLYHPRLARFIGGIARRAGPVEEVLDDTMLVVWRRARDFRAGTRVSTWIFAIAYRQTLKALHRRDEALEFREQVEAAGGGDPEAQQQRGQLRSGLDRALLQLSPEQRAAIELTYYWGHSCAEVAEILQCPVETVKTRSFYGRRRLRELLGASWQEAL
jgi:RNA polymerase sigma factor (sigma-70 family)